MRKHCVEESNKYFKNAEDFAAWEDFTTEEAKLVLGYVNGHGYDLYLSADNRYLLVDRNEPENEPEVLCDIGELIERVNKWNYELLLDDSVTGEWRESVKRDSDIIVNILEKYGTRCGYYIGQPTVKELIAILSKLPQDYRVTCCGGENYLYRFEEGKYITIDHEDFL